MIRKILFSVFVSVLLLGLTVVPAQAAAPAQIDAAITKGLTYLASIQNPDGSWPASSARVGYTGIVLLKFETHAIFLGLSPLDPSYAYSANVQNGLNYLFSKCVNIPIGIQPAGNPDTNGNGLGVECYDTAGARMYEAGIALMVISGSGAPNKLVLGGTQNGRMYKDVAQDIVDYIAWGQTDPAAGNYRGGWRYAENSPNSDNSVTGWVTLGLSYAEAAPPFGMSLTIPQFVINELKLWIAYIQDGSGASGYVDPGDWPNIYKTGNLLSEMAIVGYTQATPSVIAAQNYINNHWNDANEDPGWGKTGLVNYQACFAIMKGCMALGINKIGGTVDWYADMADRIVATQNANGSWPSDTWGTDPLTTAWAMLTLEKAAPPALSLTPLFDTNPVGTTHTVIAVYKVAGVPQQGIQINFLVTAGPNAGKSGSNTTDNNGQATFTYTGNGGVGTDTIQATAVDQEGTPLVSAQVTKDWTGTPNIVDPKTVTLVKDADGDGVPSPGDTLKYTNVITNIGNIAATGVTFTDTPDVNTKLVTGSVTTSQGNIIKGMFPEHNSVEVAIGTIPAGGKATVTFNVTINNPLWVYQVANQAIMTGTNFSSVKSDDPGTPQLNDPTITQIKPSPPIHGPAVSQWGIVAMVVLLSGAMVWVIRRRQIRSKIN